MNFNDLPTFIRSTIAEFPGVHLYIVDDTKYVIDTRSKTVTPCNNAEEAVRKIETQEGHGVSVSLTFVKPQD